MSSKTPLTRVKFSAITVFNRNIGRDNARHLERIREDEISGIIFWSPFLVPKLRLGNEVNKVNIKSKTEE